MSRLESLREMLADEPDDAFTRYAVALELVSLGRPAEAQAELATLLEKSPDYVPQYFHHAKVLHGLGRVDEAAALARRGVGVARAAGEADAARELEELLEVWE